MLRLIYLFFCLIGFVIVKIPAMLKMKKLATENDHANDPILHRIPKTWAKGFIRKTGSKVTVIGAENIPEGTVVLVGNHESDFDIPLLLGYVDKYIGFVSKVETQKLPFISAWIAIIGSIFMNRNDRRAAVQSLKEGIEKVKAGQSFVIFPEGTRNRGGKLVEFKAGALRLAKDGLAPIVPVVIEGTADIFEKNNRLIKPSHVFIKFLPAISNEELQQKDMVQLAGELYETIDREREQLRALN